MLDLLRSRTAAALLGCCALGIACSDPLDNRDLLGPGRTERPPLVGSPAITPSQSLPPPVAHWSFDEGTGTVVADAVGPNPGVVHGANWVPGRMGTALSFDGIDDHVRVNDSPSLSITGALTVALWFKTTDPAGRLLDKRAGSNNAYEAYLAPASRPGLLIDTGNATTLASALSYGDGAWHLYVGTYNRSTMAVYVDGVLVATTSRTGSMANTADPLVIGNSVDLALGFAGAIDDVRVYNVALTALEVAALFAPPPGQFDYLLTTNGDIGVVQGQSTTRAVTATLTSGTPEPVALSVSGLPVGASGAFSPSSCTPTCTTTLTIHAQAATAIGSYLVTVTGSASVTRTASFTLTVQPPVPPLAPGDFTLIVFGDTQYYTYSYPAIFDAQTRWIADHRTDMNIVFVTHVGDMVEHSNQAVEWSRASSSMATLDGLVPVGLVGGNHDLDLGWEDAVGTWNAFLQYFPVSRYDGYPWWGGFYQLGNSSRMSSYQTVSVSGMDFLFLQLEFQAPDDVLSWAASVIQAHPTHRVIVSTHQYLNEDGTRDNGGGPDNRIGANYGEDIWQALIRRHSNIFMVQSGHISSETRRISVNDSGGTVYEILTDYQMLPNGGDGWLRLYVFRPALDEIHAYTYSPTRGDFDTDAQSQFILSYDMAAAGGDLIPPSDPTGLSATAVSSSRIDLLWTASVDNVGVTGYEVERCTGVACTAFAPIAAPVATSHADLNLTAGTTYRYRVRARDAAGNRSGYSAVASATTAAGPPIPSPVAYWPFDEGAGSTAGDPVGGNQGTVSGAQWVPGQRGTALAFDGVNDNVNIGSPASLDDRQPFTLTAWVSSAAFAGNILSKRTTGQPGFWHLAALPTNTVAWLKQTSTAPQLWVVPAAGVLTPNVWQHVALTWDGTLSAQGVKIYVNGIEVASYATRRDGTGTLLSDATNNFSIGSRNGTGDFFNGVIDEVKVYSRVLTPTEMLAVYNAER